MELKKKKKKKKKKEEEEEEGNADKRSFFIKRGDQKS